MIYFWQELEVVVNQITGRGDIDLSTTWISNTIDWEYSSNLSLMSISSYVEYKTGNINIPIWQLFWPHLDPLLVQVMGSVPVVGNL